MKTHTTNKTFRVEYIKNAFDYLEKEYVLYRTKGSVDVGRVRSIENFRDDFSAIQVSRTDTNELTMVLAFNQYSMKGVTLNKELYVKVKTKIQESTDVDTGSS